MTEKKKVYCSECFHYDPWHGEHNSCWSSKFDKMKNNPIYRSEHINNPPGDPFKRNKNNDCKYYEKDVRFEPTI